MRVVRSTVDAYGKIYRLNKKMCLMCFAQISSWCFCLGCCAEWLVLTYCFSFAPKKLFQHFLVGGFNPFEKNISQIGSAPQIGMNIKNDWNHYPGFVVMWQVNSKIVCFWYPKWHHSVGVSLPQANDDSNYTNISLKCSTPTFFLAPGSEEVIHYYFGKPPHIPHIYIYIFIYIYVYIFHISW